MKKDFLKNQILYAGLTKGEYNEITPSICQQNLNVMLWSTGLAAVLLGILAFFSHFVQAMSHNTLLYFAFFLLYTLFYFFCRALRPRNSFLILSLFYFLLLMTFSFGIVVGVYQNLTMPATTFCVLLFALPLLIVDQPYRISILSAVATLLFCFCSCMVKESNVFIGDLVNAVCFMFLGIAINFHMLKTKIRDLRNRKYIEQERDTDSLTGLYARAAAYRRIEQYFASTKEFGAFLIIDIDNFKKINDSYGHSYGDAVLREMGDCIRRSFRKTDLLSRFGGDEFVAFLPYVGTRDVAESRIRDLMERLDVRQTLKEPTNRITCSVGACCYPHDGTDVETLMSCADRALYISKREGKNRYTFYQAK